MKVSDTLPPEAMRMTCTALPITSVKRLPPLGLLGIRFGLDQRADEPYQFLALGGVALSTEESADFVAPWHSARGHVWQWRTCTAPEESTVSDQLSPLEL